MSLKLIVSCKRFVIRYFNMLKYTIGAMRRTHCYSYDTLYIMGKCFSQE